MQREQDWSIQTVISIISGVGLLSTLPGALLLSAQAQSRTYSDVPADYWAQPFIQQLSDADILTGYPDGTFRPEQPIDRDEYAAVIRQAFSAEPVRAIPDASVFDDVPDDYWADAAIEEAYEAGFMGTPVTNQFKPQTELTRAEAIVALVGGLGSEGLTPDEMTAVIPASATSVATRRQKRLQPLAFPVASAVMMAPFISSRPSSPATAPTATPAAAQANGTNPDVSETVPLDLSQYYADAEQIPEYARDEVAIATQAGLIVNYPNPQLLNPNEPISRASTAALIYQVLENQSEVEPLSETSEASQYVVEPILVP